MVYILRYPCRWYYMYIISWVVAVCMYTIIIAILITRTNDCWWGGATEIQFIIIAFRKSTWTRQTVYAPVPSPDFRLVIAEGCSCCPWTLSRVAQHYCRGWVSVQYSKLRPCTSVNLTILNGVYKCDLYGMRRGGTANEQKLFLTIKLK